MDAVLFDLGFTLIYFPDSERDRVRKYCEQLISVTGLSYEELSAERYKHHFEITTGAVSLREAWGLALNAKGVNEPGLAESLERVQLTEKAVLYADALTAIRRLRKLGLKIGVLANSWPTNEVHAKELLSGEVDRVVFSHKIGFRKPHRRAYDAICSELGVKPQKCLFVSDEIFEDLWGARRLGMQTAHVRRERGAGVFHFDPDARIVEPDYEADTLLEITEQFEKRTGGVLTGAGPGN